MIATPTLPPSGRLDVAMTQSSHDRAHDQVQVLITNGTARTVHPQRMVYRDARLTSPITAERLRAMPPTSHRQFPLPLPAPRCDGPRPARTGGSGTLTITAAGRVTDRPVTDVNADLGRYVAAECFRLAVTRMVRLAWSPAVTGGNLTLDVRRTGVPGRVRLLAVNGTYLFGPEHGGAWAPRTTLGNDDVRLPVEPVRCDGHAFSEGGTAATFRLTLRAEGVTGSFELPMSEAGKRALIADGLHTCGLD
ncbi:hypothetical protein GCM10027076_10690 [Nocardioides montaniterrae]